VVGAVVLVFCSWCFRPLPDPVFGCWAFAVDTINAIESAATTRVLIPHIIFVLTFFAHCMKT
jgi:hypothetical protein